MVNVRSIPERLEDRVGKACEQNVLHGLFAEIMIDAVDLGFVQSFMNLQIQLLSRLQIGAEGFFQNHAPLAAVLVQLT